MTPTQRSLIHLREQGYLCEVVERWIPGANVRRDLFTFIDIIALRDAETVGVQVTTTSNMAARVRKIAEAETVGAVREANWRIVVHGWAKRGRPARWVLTELDVS